MPVINPNNLLSRKELDLCMSTKCFVKSNSKPGRGAGYTDKFSPLRIVFKSMSARLCIKCWDKYNDEKNRYRPKGGLQTDMHDRWETHHDTYMHRYLSLSESNGVKGLDSEGQ